MKYPQLGLKITKCKDRLEQDAQWNIQKIKRPNHFGTHKIDWTSQQKHFYLQGPPDTGKTTYWKKNLDINHVNIGPSSDDWKLFDDFKPWVIFDQWSIGQARNINIEKLIKFMQNNQRFKLKATSKNKYSYEPHIFVFCSNFKPEETIPKKFQQSFLSQINIILF